MAVLLFVTSPFALSLLTRRQARTDYPLPPLTMADGPNFEAVFQGMKCLHGGNENDVKIIIQYLRFYKDTDQFELYANHYLPMLSEEAAAEFAPKKAKTAVVEVTASPEEPKVTETTTVSISAPKKKGRPAKSV